MAAFDPSNPQAFFSNMDNLSPAYTSDPNAASSQLQNLQAALAWAQANPSDPNSSYYISQLTPAIQEQQNISNYIGAQTQGTQLTTQLNNLNTQLNYVTQPDVNGTGGFAHWLSDTKGMNAQGINPANMPALMNEYKAFVSNLLNQINTVTNQISQNQNTVSTDKGNWQNNITFAQPNYAQNDANLANYWNGVQQNVVAPQEQDIYQTAYNIKNNIAEKMNLTGQLNSGAAIKEKGLTNENALQQDTSLQNAFNTQKQTSLAGQKTADQEAQNAYQNEINSMKGQNLGTSLAGSATNLNNAYNQNTQAQLQKAQNQFENNFAKTQSSDNFVNQVGSDLGGLAGTLTGGII